MGVAIGIINAVMALLPQFVGLFEQVLGVDHPAVVDLRNAHADFQTAHAAAISALPPS